MPEGGGAQPAGPRTGTIRASRRARGLIVTAGVLAVLLTACTVLARVWTDWLWYRSVHYSSVFTTTLWTRVGLFCVFGLLMAAAVGANIFLAHRLRPPLSAMSPEQQGLDRYRMGIAPHKKGVLLGICAAVALVAGASASAQWRLWLLYANATPFHASDPQFHKDVSFYAFRLPWYRFLLSFGFASVVLCLVAAVLVHYLYGGLRITSPGARTTAAATGHLSVLLGLFVSLKAAAYWLDRYGLAVKSGGLRTDGDWTGLRYVDARAYLPAKTILFCIAVICALLFFATLRRRTWSLPLIGLGLMALSAVLVGGLYPAIVQKFQVQPDEAAKEAPYIERNIDATRAAYGIGGGDVRQYGGTGTSAASSTGAGTGGTRGTSGAGTGASAAPGAKSAGPAASRPSAAALRADAAKAASIRVLDPGVVSPAFQQAQQAPGYYSFPSTLDVDRYTVDGGEQDTVVGVRELNSAGIPEKNWINDHFRYTHGYGVVAAKGTSVTAGGDPATGDLGPYRKPIYFGEKTTQYAIVGGPTKEVDYPDGDGGRTTSYAGKDGVRLDGTLTRAAYAMAFGEPQILYSGAIGHGSKILYDRTPEERVEAVAPWLTLDGDPYPAVVDRKVVWIVDAYTTTDGYPYASRTTLGGTTADPSAGGRHPGARRNQVNYVRNSVKATVDAYDGTVTLYQWDTADPVLRTWMKAFPHTVRPRSAIPADLLAHLRYPQDLFKVQRQMLAAYHVTSAAQFYSGSQAWQVPDDPASKSGKAVPPYYLSVRMPGRSAKAFSLTTTFTPAGRDRLAAFMSVDADARSPDYGTLRILRLPADGTQVDGPRQVQGKFTADKDFAPGLDLLGRGGSTVEYGDMLTVPLDGGMLYVEPVYARGAGTGLPQLRKVLVDFDGKLAFEDTLDEALDTVFAAAGSPAASPSASPGGSPDGSPKGTPPAAGSPPGGARAKGGGDAGPGGPAADLSAALTDAQKAYDDGQAAMRKGDWKAYGAAQDRLAGALKRAESAQAAQAAAAAGGSGGGRHD